MFHLMGKIHAYLYVFFKNLLHNRVEIEEKTASNRGEYPFNSHQAWLRSVQSVLQLAELIVAVLNNDCDATRSVSPLHGEYAIVLYLTDAATSRVKQHRADRAGCKSDTEKRRECKEFSK